MTDVFILSAARTPVGSFGGSLSGLGPIDLATHVAKAAIARAGVEAGQIGTSERPRSGMDRDVWVI